MELVISIILWGTLWGGLCSIIAHGRNRDAMGWFFLGFLFSFFALIAILAVPANEPGRFPAQQSAQAPPLPTDKTCPRCAETIKAAAIACRFCGYEYPAGEVAAIKAATLNASRNKMQRRAPAFLPGMKCLR